MKQSVQFSIEVPASIRITATLATADGEKLPRRTLVQREGTRATILATFPRAGRWFVHLHAKPGNASGPYWRAATFVFDSTSGTARAFPKSYETYHKFQACLLGPLYVPLGTTKPIAFQIQVPGADEVHLVVGKRWLKMSNSAGEKDLYRVTTTVATGATVVLTAKMPGAAAHNTLLSFTPKPE